MNDADSFIWQNLLEEMNNFLYWYRRTTEEEALALKVVYILDFFMHYIFLGLNLN